MTPSNISYKLPELPVVPLNQINLEQNSFFIFMRTLIDLDDTDSKKTMADILKKTEKKPQFIKASASVCKVISLAHAYLNNDPSSKKDLQNYLNSLSPNSN